MKECLRPIALLLGTVLCATLAVGVGLLSIWSLKSDDLPAGAASVAIGLRFYVAFFILGAGLAAWLRRRSFSNGGLALARSVWWIRLWHGWVFLIMGSGALIGAILFPLGGFVLGVDLPLMRLIQLGMQDGAFFSGIWAPGLSLVLCVMIAHDSFRSTAGFNAERSRVGQ